MKSLVPEATMLGSFRAIKFGLAVLAVAAMLAVTPTLSHAATGSVRITISRNGFIFGGGSGTLHFQGKRYPLRVGGVSVGPLGAPRVDLVGRAYHMRNAASIHGIYSAVAGDVAAPSGPKVMRLQNWHGVVLELRGRQGVKPSVHLSGLEISLR
jgi:hypothetical protein